MYELIAMAVLVLAIASIVTALALKLATAKDEREAARVLVASLTGELAASKANAATQINRADSEKARADALDDLIASAASDRVDGAYERLLRKWTAARLADADVTSTRKMPTTTTTKEAGPDDLLRPDDG